MKLVKIIFILLPSLVHGGEIKDLFFELNSNPDFSNLKEFKSAPNNILEVGLERAGCYGSCPQYSVIIKADGTFRYTGKDFVEKIGSYTGQVSKHQLSSLLKFINESKFAELEAVYNHQITDHFTVYTMVRTNENVKVIYN